MRKRLLMVLVLTAAACQPGAATPSSASDPMPSPSIAPSPAVQATPTQAPTAPPSPTPRTVTLKASQFILPLNELPLSGLKVIEDSGDDFFWRRNWDPVAAIGARYFFVVVEVGVSTRGSSPEKMAADAFASLPCEPTRARGGLSSNQPPTTAVQISAPTVGDASHACGFGFADGYAHIEYAATTRNVLVLVQVGPSLVVSQTEATDLAVAIARRQIEVLDRVAPRG